MAERRLLPERRTSWTQKLDVGGQRLYVGFGEYEDGTLGEIFITVALAGSAFRAVMDAFAVSFSLGLQHGVPLRTAVEAMKKIDFLPNGPVRGIEDLGVTQATSMLAAIAELIENTYLKNEEAQINDAPA